jgi:hypothetical protein
MGEVSTKVLNCKAKPPVEGADVVAEQISRAHRYYNRLVELHRAFRAAADAAKLRHIPGLAEAEAAVTAADAAVETLCGQIKHRNAAARRKAASPEDREALAAARATLVAARAERKRLRQQAADNADYQAELARLVVEYQGELPDADATRRVGGHFKTARAECGVYSGSYLRVEAAFEAAKNTSMGDPRFRRWTGDGVVGPQLTPPLSVRQLLQGGDSRLRLEFLPGPASERRSQRVLWWVRVASDGRDPVWCKIPAHLSRGQLPDDGVIKWASVVRRQVGVRRKAHPDIPEGVWVPYYEWSVQLTLQTEDTKPRATTGAAGVNLGWRAMEDGGLRVGYVVGTDGRNEPIELPAKLVERWGKARSIQGFRDTNFDDIRARLVEWLANHPHPDWLAEACKLLPAWRSKRRLGGVHGCWSRERFDGDAEMFAALTAWRERDVHLEQYELMLLRRAERGRQGLYRRVAADLRKRYRFVYVDDTDYRTVKRRPAADSNEAVNETAKRNAQVAAPGRLRSLICQSGGIAVEAANITQTCHLCKHVNVWDSASGIMQTCDGCGEQLDQDENAAHNLLASGSVVDETPGTARGPDDGAGDGDTAVEPAKGGKWARRKANRSRKPPENPPESEVA